MPRWHGRMDRRRLLYIRVYSYVVVWKKEEKKKKFIHKSTCTLQSTEYIVPCTMAVDLCLPKIQMYSPSTTLSTGQGIQAWIGREYSIGLRGECHTNGHQGLPACYVHQAAETDSLRRIKQFWGIT